MSIKIPNDISDLKVGNKNIDYVFAGDKVVGQRTKNTSWLIYMYQGQTRQHFFGPENTTAMDFIHNNIDDPLTINGKIFDPKVIGEVHFMKEMIPVMNIIPDNFLQYMPMLQQVTFEKPFGPIVEIGKNFCARCFSPNTGTGFMITFDLSPFSTLTKVGDGFLTRNPGLEYITLGSVQYDMQGNARTSVTADLCKQRRDSSYITLVAPDQIFINSFKRLFPTVSRINYYRRYTN